MVPTPPSDSIGEGHLQRQGIAAILNGHRASPVGLINGRRPLLPQLHDKPPLLVAYSLRSASLFAFEPVCRLLLLRHVCWHSIASAIAVGKTFLEGCAGLAFAHGTIVNWKHRYGAERLRKGGWRERSSFFYGFRSGSCQV
jgi:hypothetical protein